MARGVCNPEQRVNCNRGGPFSALQTVGRSNSHIPESGPVEQGTQHSHLFVPRSKNHDVILYEFVNTHIRGGTRPDERLDALHRLGYHRLLSNMGGRWDDECFDLVETVQGHIR